MGNSLVCFFRNGERERNLDTSSSSGPTPQNGKGSVNRSNSRKTRPAMSSSSKKETLRMDDEFIKQQAVAAALLFRQHQQNGGSLDHLQFDRSKSLKDPAPPPSYPSKKENKFPRSSSSRPRSIADSLTHPHHLINQDVKIEDLETKHIVLVHGGGFGAWCWYKTIALLNEVGFKVDAVDLTGSGVHSYDTNGVESLAQYVKPLTDFLEKLEDGNKVILVGHAFGGACISYAMELYPSKVSKAIFLAAAMLASGQSTIDMFSQEEGLKNVMQSGQTFVYAKGKNQPPTAIDLDKSRLAEYLFNRSPAKDVALASVSMRPVPFAPVTEKLSLSEENYGSVRRFYIKTEEDFAIPITIQEAMISSNPPEQVLLLKGSDHSPFFSKPQTLHKLLVEISRCPPNKAQDR